MSSVRNRGMSYEVWPCQSDLCKRFLILRPDYPTLDGGISLLGRPCSLVPHLAWFSWPQPHLERELFRSIVENATERPGGCRSVEVGYLAGVWRFFFGGILRKSKRISIFWVVVFIFVQGDFVDMTWPREFHLYKRIKRYKQFLWSETTILTVYIIYVQYNIYITINVLSSFKNLNMHMHENDLCCS